MSLILFGSHVDSWMQILTDKTLYSCNMIYCKTYEELIKIKNINGILYIMEKDCILLRNYQKYLITNIDHVILLSSKDRFGQFMTNNFPQYIPNIYTYPNLKFPCLYKLNRANNGYGSKIINNINDLANINNDNINNGIFQEYLEHDIEYVTHCIVHNGIIINQKSYQYTILNNELIKSCYTNVIRETINHMQYNYIWESILSKINYTGICCIDYIILNEQPKIFEINPRLGSSLIENRHDLIDMLNSYINLL